MTIVIDERRAIGDALDAFNAGRSSPSAPRVSPKSNGPGPNDFWRLLLSAQKLDAAPAGEFAAWRRSPKDSNFFASETFRYMDRAATALDGYESYFFGRLLREFGIRPEGRVRPPAKGMHLAFAFPKIALDTFLFSVHPEKGIHLQFPESVPLAAREGCWWALAVEAEHARQVLETDGLPRDDFEPRPIEWWSFVKKEIQGVDAFRITIIGSP